MSEHSEEFVGGPPERPEEAEPDPDDLMHRFQSPPPNRRRRQRAGHQPNVPPSAVEQNQLAVGAQIAAQHADQEQARLIEAS